MHMQLSRRRPERCIPAESVLSARHSILAEHGLFCKRSVKQSHFIARWFQQNTKCTTTNVVRLFTATPCFVVWSASFLSSGIACCFVVRLALSLSPGIACLPKTTTGNRPLHCESSFSTPRC
ncbi:unnamed protein product [Ixodes persulcatus]